MTWVNEEGLAMTWEKGGFWIPACAGMASRFGEDGDEGACNAPLHFGDTPGERELGLIPLEGTIIRRVIASPSLRKDL